MPLPSSALQPFIGRETELREIARLLANPACRMLTLVGPGGIGKTRLALEAVQRMAVPDGVHIVLFQPLTSPDFMVSTIAEALGIQFYAGTDPKQQLLDYLQDKAMLLVLDNLEHLLDGVGLFSEILAAAPDVRLLITSRERLNLREEWVLDVDGLHYPANESESQIESHDAVRLFVQHTQRIKSGFALNEENKPAVIRICRMVDGMPLAIELAAAWVRALSCEAIADEIAHSLDILETSARNVEPRHRSMRAAFEPTWERMSEDERGVFMKLSVFRGGFTREAAEQVAGASLHILVALADKSLLRVDENGRYDLHELLRQYGQQRLEESDVSDTVKDLHKHFFMKFVGKLTPDLKGSRQVAAYDEIEADFDNIASAWDRAIDQKDYELLDPATEAIALSYFYFARSTRMRDLLRQAEKRLMPAPGDNPHPVWCHIYVRAVQDYEKDWQTLERCLAIAQEQNDQAEIAFCLWVMSHFASGKHGHQQAERLLTQSLQHYRALDDRFYTSRVLHDLIIAYDFLGKRDQVATYLEECRSLRRSIGDTTGIVLLNGFEAWITEIRGDYVQAEKFRREILAYQQSIRNKGGIALEFAHLSRFAFYRGDLDEARQLAADAIRDARNAGWRHPHIWATTTMALIANVEENYELSRRLQHDIQNEGVAFVVTEIIFLCGAITACGLPDFTDAKFFIQSLLKYGDSVHAPAYWVWPLPAAACVLVQEGKTEQAVAVLSLAFNHPVTTMGWLVRWPLLQRLQEQLKSDLGEPTYAAAWERGKHFNLEVVATELLTRFSAERDKVRRVPNKLSNNQLTERELEILRLLAQGHSNREVAEILVIAIGTVKGHVYRIYQKLGVQNRTRALIRAQDLGLIE